MQQPPPTRDSTNLAIIAAVVIIVALVGAIGFLVLTGDEDSEDSDVAADERSDDQQDQQDPPAGDDQPANPTLVHIEDIEVGQCFDEPEMDEQDNVEQVPMVDCSAVHVYEVFDQFELEDGLWPGQESVTNDARSGCDDRFEDFVGIPKDDSELEGFFLAPTVASWDGFDDRTVTCFVTDENNDTTGTLEGAAR